jgi:TonB family protein
MLGMILFLVGVLATGVYLRNQLARKRKNDIFLRWPVRVALAVDLLALLGQCNTATQAAVLPSASLQPAEGDANGQAPPRKGSIATIFSEDDYPAEAFKNGWEGDVGIKVRVGVDGRPHSCWILHSSGYAVLDVQTCAIVLGRARFVPARDSNGDAVIDDFVLPTVRWAIDGSTRPHLAADLTPVQANWERVGKGDAGQAYLDVNSIAHRGDIGIAWVKSVFAQAMPDGTTYRVGQYRYDCANKSSTLLLGEGFRADGTAVLIVQFPEVSQTAHAVAPNSAMDVVLRRVCR